MERWAINIDIEGFSATYEKSEQGLYSLQALMEGIYFIGNKWCPDPPERIFAHQLVKRDILKKIRNSLHQLIIVIPRNGLNPLHCVSDPWNTRK